VQRIDATIISLPRKELGFRVCVECPGPPWNLYISPYLREGGASHQGMEEVTLENYPQETGAICIARLGSLYVLHGKAFHGFKEVWEGVGW
jgi:hypothetical protein